MRGALARKEYCVKDCTPPLVALHEMLYGIKGVEIEDPDRLAAGGALRAKYFKGSSAEVVIKSFSGVGLNPIGFKTEDTWQDPVHGFPFLRYRFALAYPEQWRNIRTIERGLAGEAGGDNGSERLWVSESIVRETVSLLWNIKAKAVERDLGVRSKHLNKAGYLGGSYKALIQNTFPLFFDGAQTAEGAARQLLSRLPVGMGPGRMRREYPVLAETLKNLNRNIDEAIKRNGKRKLPQSVRGQVFYWPGLQPLALENTVRLLWHPELLPYRDAMRHFAPGLQWDQSDPQQAVRALLTRLYPGRDTAVLPSQKLTALAAEVQERPESRDSLLSWFNNRFDVLLVNDPVTLGGLLLVLERAYPETFMRLLREGAHDLDFLRYFSPHPDKRRLLMLLRDDYLLVLNFKKWGERWAASVQEGVRARVIAEWDLLPPEALRKSASAPTAIDEAA